MTPFGPLQPGEVAAILATAADMALTLYGVLSGRAREGNWIYGHGKKAAVLVAVGSVVLHFVVRALLAGTPERGFDPRQGSIWSGIAVVRGAVAAGNLRVLIRHRRGG